MKVKTYSRTKRSESNKNKTLTEYTTGKKIFAVAVSGKWQRPSNRLMSIPST